MEIEIPKSGNAIDKWIKSYIEKDHKIKKPDDSEIKIPYTDSRGENLESHCESS